jgi:hypothetical protein
MTNSNEKLNRPPLPTEEQIMSAFNRGLRTALLQHKRAGVPIVVWEDGKVVQIPAEEILIPKLPDADAPS